MPNWNAILKEIESAKATPSVSQFDVVRRKYLAELHNHTGRNLICYYSAFLSKPTAKFIQLSDEDKNGLMLCVHKLDKSKGLDLVLHTSGGDIGAVESIVFYLREMFGGDIRAIVPQLAMSAGAVIACACNEILMGKHSAIGPVDPQLNGIPAIGALQEFDRAYNDIKNDERYNLVWDPILSRLTPSFLEQCRWAVARSEEFLATALRTGMFNEEPEEKREELISRVVKGLTTHDKNPGHNRHIHYDECIDLGLKIKMLEDPKERKLQDLVLTVHHTYMHTLSNTAGSKIIENHLGRAHVKLEMQQSQLFPFPPELQQTVLQTVKQEHASELMVEQINT